jgi:hypothetical protein
MLTGTTFRWRLAAILVVALAVRWGAGIWWQGRLPEGREFGFPDSESYWELARNVAAGDPYTFGPERLAIFRTPGYPILLAPLFLLGGDNPPVLWARALSALLGALAVGGVAQLGKALFDDRVGLLAGAIAALYPEAISLGVFVLSEAPFCPLMVWQLVAWTYAWQSATDTFALSQQTIRWGSLAGLLAALAVLMRPSWLLFVPFAGIAGMIVIPWLHDAAGPSRSTRLGRHVQLSGVIFVAMCVALIPWWGRNYLITGRFIPTTLQVGASLYDGLGPQATGGSDMRFVSKFVAAQHAADKETAHLTGTFEERLDRRLRDASIAWSQENPGRVLQLAGTKLVRMWSPVPNAAEFGSLSLRLILAASYTPLILLAAYGAIRFVRRDWPYWLCVLPAMYFTCLHMIFVSSIRYRQPAMLVLAVLAAAAAIGLIDRLCHRSSSKADRR